MVNSSSDFPNDEINIHEKCFAPVSIIITFNDPCIYHDQCDTEQLITYNSHHF